MAMMVRLDQRWIEDFITALGGLESKNKRVALETLWQLHHDVMPHRPDTADRRRVLLELLRHAQAAGVLEFPVQAWEKSGEPALPKFINRILEIKAPAQKWWLNYLWCPELAWVTELHVLSEDHGEFLKRVQEGIVHNWFKDLASPKLRSLQLTVGEKKLERLMRGPLFQPGRLTRAMLNCTSDVTPLFHHLIGSKPVALVFENKAAFYVALSVLQSLPNPPYGVLAFGAGNSFQDSIRYFHDIQQSKPYQQQIGTPLERIEYLGDLDWAGLKIALGAQKRAQTENLPPLIPARGLHRVLLEACLEPTINKPDGILDDKPDRVPSEEALLWLPQDVQAEARRILERKNRVPEEMIPAAALERLWAID
jgi:hypothetical protein